MATYAIGDIQGCFAPFQALLQQIHFNPDQDTLWLTGDLVNRGAQSLEVLRFVKSLGNKHQVVLGNHDLHLLAVASGASPARRGDTLDAILKAPDIDDLLNWLRFRPLLVHDESNQVVMTHAGLAPAWTLAKAKALAKEMEAVLQGYQCRWFLKNMYGNEPAQWQDDLTGADRWRCIINYFTRMRFCHQDGRLDLSYKGNLTDAPASLVPWFDVPSPRDKNLKLIFGHWAALMGQTTQPNLFALDTGCVWGNCLTALNIATGEKTSVTC